MSNEVHVYYETEDGIREEYLGIWPKRMPFPSKGDRIPIKNAMYRIAGITFDPEFRITPDKGLSQITLHVKKLNHDHFIFSKEE